MMGDLDDILDIGDEVDTRTSRTEVRGRKRGRVAKGIHAEKGSLKAILGRSKGRTKKVSLPSIDPKRS